MSYFLFTYSYNRILIKAMLLSNYLLLKASNTFLQTCYTVLSNDQLFLSTEISPLAASIMGIVLHFDLCCLQAYFQ
jgi:hypothetical protein